MREQGVILAFILVLSLPRSAGSHCEGSNLLTCSSLKQNVPADDIGRTLIFCTATF